METAPQERTITISPGWLAVAGTIVAIGLWGLWRVWMAPSPATGPVTSAGTAVVQFVNGNPQVFRQYAPDTPVALVRGMSVHAGDQIVVPSGAVCQLAIQEGAQVVGVQAGSGLIVKSIEPTEMGLAQGTLYCLIKQLPAGSQFRVRTPTAVYGVRGTGWEVTATAEASAASVFEGVVHVEAPQKPQPQFVVTAGQQVEVDTSADPVMVAEVKEEAVEAWEVWKGQSAFHEVGDLVVAEFDTVGSVTDLGTPFGAWNPFPSDPSQGVTNEFSEEHWGAEGKGMRIDYDVASPNPAYGGFWIQLRHRDLRIYDTVVFWIKGDPEAGSPKAIKAELKNDLGDEGQVGFHFITELSDQWQRFAIPFTAFRGIDQFERMTELVFTVSDLTAGDKEGAFYLDHISFTRQQGE